MTTMPGDDEQPPPEHDPRADAAEQVEALARSNAESNQTLLRLVERVRQDANMRERKVDLLEEGHKQTRILVIMVGVILVIMVALGIANAINIGATRKNAEVIAGTAVNASDTWNLLYGCFEPNSQCSKINAEKQRQVLDEIKLYQLTVLYCVRINPGTEDPDGDAFIACVNRLYPGGPQLKGR